MARTVPAASEQYTLTAPQLEGTRADLNGKELTLGAGYSIPRFKGVKVPAGVITLPAASVTFLVVLSKGRGRPLGLCGCRLPELNLIPIRVIDPSKATEGLIHPFGVNLYSLLF